MKKRGVIIIIAISLIISFFIYSYLASWVNSMQQYYWVGNCVQVSTFVATNILAPEKEISLKSIAYNQNPFSFGGFSSYKTMIKYLEENGIESAFYLDANSEKIKKAIDDGNIPVAQLMASDPGTKPNFMNPGSHFVTITNYSEENGSLTGFYLFDSYFWFGREITEYYANNKSAPIRLNYTEPYYMNISEFEMRWNRPMVGHIFWVDIEKISNPIGFNRALTVVGESGGSKVNWKISFIVNAMYVAERSIVTLGHSAYNLSKYLPYLKI